MITVLALIFLTLIILNVVHWLIFESSQLCFNNVAKGQNILLVVQLSYIFDDLSYRHSTVFWWVLFFDLFWVFFLFFVVFVFCLLLAVLVKYHIFIVVYIVLVVVMVFIRFFFHSLLWRKLSYLDCLFCLFQCCQLSIFVLTFCVDLFHYF